jgi:hypothetical protein
VRGGVGWLGLGYGNRCEFVGRWEEVLGGECRVWGCVGGGGWQGEGSGVWDVRRWDLGN